MLKSLGTGSQNNYLFLTIFAGRHFSGTSYCFVPSVRTIPFSSTPYYIRGMLRLKCSTYFLDSLLLFLHYFVILRLKYKKTMTEGSIKYIEDEVYGQRLLISVNADQRELRSNIRAARAILNSFDDVTIIINAHTMSFGHKNPEYTIDGQLGDRKGIMGEKGVTAGFKTAKKQGCKIVVIDLDEHILQVRSFELSKYISRRKADFVNGMITACYVVFDGEAVVVNASIQTRKEIMMTIEMLNPGTSSY